MTALLAGGELVRLQGEAAGRALEEARRALDADRLVPYLGPGLLGLEAAPAVPVLPEDVARELHRRTPAPSRIRTNMWSVAQYIESRRHRKTLRAHMAAIFAAEAVPTAFHRFLAGLPLSMIVDTWYDGTMRAALAATGRTDFIDVQGISRAGINRDVWFDAYDAADRTVPPEAADHTPTLLYTPHGGVRPAANFLVADSDYVEVLTEIDIQTPIPLAVRERRTHRGFLFLGCRFHDQMLRTYARQIIKRSAGPHFAVGRLDEMTPNEAKFLAAEEIALIDVPLVEATARLASG